jgi:V8-like Glu-specific endopeptidase
VNRASTKARLPVIASCLALSAASVGCAPTQTIRPIPAAQQDADTRGLLSPITLTNDPTADAVVRVVGAVSCTGTLIADDLVLTAHHCVSARDAHGRVLAEDVDPSILHVEIGGGDFPYGEVTVRTFVAPECGYAQGEGDIAILVLSRKLVGMPTWTARIDRAPRVGETTDPMGFGRCALESTTIHREIRQGGKVITVTPGQIVADASICPGDSGGPVFDSHQNTRREVLGVVSASVMDTSSKTVGMSYFTRLDVWQPLFSAAREIADGADPNALPPFRSCMTPGSD